MASLLSHPQRWWHNFESKNRFRDCFWNRRKFIIQSDYAGLGDHLFLSHLPRIAKQDYQAEKVLVSNLSPFRDGAVKNLVWETNPYVDGFTDEPGWPLSPPHSFARRPSASLKLLLRFGLENRIGTLDRGCNLLDQIMLTLGMDDGTRFHDPELYLQIQPRDEYKSLVVYDPNYITNAGALTSDSIERFFQEQGVQVQAQLATRNKVMPLRYPTSTIYTRDLLDFCCLIKSCKALYSLTTGTATLAAALGKSCSVLYGDGVNTLYHHSKLHRYIKL